jgi:hypothetical protein
MKYAEAETVFRSYLAKLNVSARPCGRIAQSIG